MSDAGCSIQASIRILVYAIESIEAVFLLVSLAELLQRVKSVREPIRRPTESEGETLELSGILLNERVWPAMRFTLRSG